MIDQSYNELPGVVPNSSAASGDQERHARTFNVYRAFLSRRNSDETRIIEVLSAEKED